MKIKLIIIGILLLIVACSKSNDQDLSHGLSGTPGTDGGPCDTSNVTYKTVAGIIAAHCYSCHSEANKALSNNIVLEGYAALKIRADDGQLLGVIIHAPNYPQMPQGAPKLSDCNINKIKSWLNNGKQNN